MKKALIAMSGGVDSSVAAYLVKESGMECTGCTMKLYDNDDINLSKTNTCCSLDDVEDARSVARRLDMPYYVFNFKDDFNEKIISKFVSCYEQGITPNPCIDCNKHMKFDRLHERAKELGLDYVVTGHYAQIEEKDGRFYLKKAVDETKDQSYVLYEMDQEKLAHTLFPLGGLKKTETREIAEKMGFINANKPDSQDICFVPDGDYASFIEKRTGKACEPGNFVDKDGKVLGKHKGIIHYTIGQRRGLGIAAKESLYVIKIDAQTNEVVLGFENELMTRDVYVKNFHWISGETPVEPIKCRAKLRYRQKERDAILYPLSDGRVKITFDEMLRAGAPGQAAVVYLDDYVLGGGIIE